MKSFPMTWNLDRWFSGGARSKGFRDAVSGLKAEMEDLAARIKDAEAEPVTIASILSDLQSCLAKTRHCRNFTECLLAGCPACPAVQEAVEISNALPERYESLSAAFNRHLAALNSRDWQHFIEMPQAAEVAHCLEVRRSSQSLKPGQAQGRTTAETPSVSLHDWETRYHIEKAHLTAEPAIGSGAGNSPLSRATDLLDSQRASVRHTAFHHIEQAWSRNESVFAEIINAISGKHLENACATGQSSVLEQSVRSNHIRHATLTAMWQAVEEAKRPLTAYLRKRMELLKLPALHWVDITAPLKLHSPSIPYQQAADIIHGSVSEYSESIAEVIEQAFRRQWIDAEKRPGKAGGGFCTPAPLLGESRIHINYEPGIPGCLQLAHELGHACHQTLVQEMPPLAQLFPKTLAEAAAVFNEHVVMRALCRIPEYSLAEQKLLDTRLQSAVLHLMNIRSRYLFEEALYRRRSHGPLPATELNRLMEDAQKEAYGDILESGDPHFWASKVHFYLVDEPFYNYSYTFGYLLSFGLMEALEQNASQFAETYPEFLTHSGCEPVETLMKRYFAADITDVRFWRKAVSRIAADAERFVSLS